MVVFNYQADFKLDDEVAFSKWIRDVVKSEKKMDGDISYVFCTDDFLLDINQRFLNHDTFTDIITFDYCEEDTVNGEIYISVDRVKENADSFMVSFDQELRRVMSHGVLHLCGYGDKSVTDKQVMTDKENEKINMFHVKQ